MAKKAKKVTKVVKAKKVKKLEVEMEMCIDCGEEFPENKLVDGYCKDCVEANKLDEDTDDTEIVDEDVDECDDDCDCDVEDEKEND